MRIICMYTLVWRKRGTRSWSRVVSSEFNGPVIPFARVYSPRRDNKLDLNVCGENDGVEPREEEDEGLRM